MAAKTDNKSLELLLNRFHELTANTKELDTTVSNFSAVAENFRITLELLEQSHSFKELEKLSKEAVAKLKEVKSLNELQMIEKLKEVMNKELTSANQKLEAQMKKMIVKPQEPDKSRLMQESELMNVLQQMNKKLDNVQSAPASSSDEMVKLKRHVAALSAKMKKMEEDYEERILVLEYEVEELRERLESTTANNTANKQVGKPVSKVSNKSESKKADWLFKPSQTNVIDIDDDDLPF